MFSVPKNGVAAPLVYISTLPHLGIMLSLPLLKLFCYLLTDGEKNWLAKHKDSKKKKKTVGAPY
jgi:hypothetical protein